MALTAALLLAAVLPASAFSPGATGRLPVARAPASPRVHDAATMVEKKTPGTLLPRIPIRSAVLGLITLQAAADLTNDIPGLLGASPDYFRTIFDLGFFGYGTTQLLGQAGVRKAPSNPPADLAGLRCRVTLNVGREPGTWMPKDWASSGARLSLPTFVTFLDEEVDLGFPGEESFGGRNAKRLDCEGSSFVGINGEVIVNATGGAWTCLPTGRPGENMVRFFIDFPEGASRNDVTIPAGRVFFSTACFESEDERIINALTNECVRGPGNVLLLNQGGLTIKRNDWRNFYGGFGDVNLILGRFSVAAADP